MFVLIISVFVNSTVDHNHPFLVKREEINYLFVLVDMYLIYIKRKLFVFSEKFLFQCGMRVDYCTHVRSFYISFISQYTISYKKISNL